MEPIRPKKNSNVKTFCKYFYKYYFTSVLPSDDFPVRGSIQVVSWFLLSTNRTRPLGCFRISQPAGKGSGN